MVDDFIALRYEELLDIFDTFQKGKSKGIPIGKDVQRRIQMAWIYTMDRFRTDGLAEKASDILNWDQTNYDFILRQEQSIKIANGERTDDVVATSSTSGPSNIAQHLLPSAILDKLLLKLAEICRLGHEDNDEFAMKCVQERIHTVDDFLLINYAEIETFFATFRQNNKVERMPTGVVLRIRSAWL